jgi:hypothetical protein
MLDTAQPLRITLAEFRACERLLSAPASASKSASTRRPIEPPELDAELVGSVEIELESSLPDDVLAVFAARVHGLESAWQMSLARVVEHSRAAWAVGCPQTRLAIGREAVSEVFLCVKRHADPKRESILELYDRSNGSTQRQPLAEWLRDRLDFAVADLAVHHANAESRVRVGGTECERIETFRPGIATRKVAVADEGGRRVRHKTFGEGVVVREVAIAPERKIEIEFPAVGRKVLLERFIEYVD